MADYKNDNIYKMAEQGDVQAMFLVGVSFGLGGDDFPKDRKQEFIWMKKAADKEHAYAQAYMGILYQYGAGVEKKKIFMKLSNGIARLMEMALKMFSHLILF